MKKTELTADNASFLADLIHTAPSIPSIAIPQGSVGQAPPSASAEVKPRRATKPGFYDKSWETIAHLVALTGAGVLWWIGAHFTLQFLGGLGINLARLGYAQWLIPLGITGVELKFWPKEGLNRNLFFVFVFFAACDLLSSTIGGVEWAASRVLPQVGWRLPDQTNMALWIISLVLAGICAFWPERLARAAVYELRKLWKI